MAVMVTVSTVFSGGAAASGHLVTASEHTTDSDFNNGTYTNLSVSGSGTSAQLELRPGTATDTVDRPADDSSSTGITDRYGVTVETDDYRVHNLTANVSSRVSGASTGYILDSNDQVVESSSIQSGEVSFSTELDANSKYYIALDNDGNSYQIGYRNHGFPKTSTHLNITAGYTGGAESNQNSYNIRDVEYDYNTSTDPGKYTSDAHDASKIEEGFANLDLDGVDATVEWQGNDGSGWTTVSTSTYSTDGEKTDSLSGDYDQWRVVVDFQPTWTFGKANLSSEGVKFNDSAPDLDNSSASPNNERIDSESTTLEINLTDDDFSTVQSDELTLYWYHNDQLDGTTTVTANGTASYTLNDLNVGENTWHVTAEDDWGNTATTGNDSFSFTAPENMTIYNESAPETKINDREVTAEFFDLNGDEIYTATTTNGEIELSQLNESTFLVRLTARDYADRRVIIKDIWSQQDVWMLNESNSQISTVQPTFLIEDETGDYDPSDSRVYIQRGLNISGTTTYKTIAAEEVGTDGYTETIEKGQRYRIIVENQDGDRRVLGKFSAADSNTYTLTVEELTFDLSKDQEAIEWGFNYTEVENAQDKVNFRYNDPEDDTDSLEVVIYERGNQSNELHNQTYSGPIGEVSVTEPVPSGQENNEWVVEWSAERSGNTSKATLAAGPLGTVTLPTSDRLLHTMAVGFILIVGGLASQVNAPAVGLTTAGTAGIAYYIGWLPGAVAGGMIVLAFFVPVLYLVQSEGGFG